MWAGVLAFGAAPFVLLGLPFLGVNSPPGTQIWELAPLLLLTTGLALFISTFAFYTGRYLRREVGSLQEYAGTLSDSSSRETISLDFSNLSSIRKTIVAYILLNALTVPLFIFGGTGTLLQNLEDETPYLWSNWILATFIWTFGYSMYSIHRMGRLPLRLKRHTQDRNLGLKPFATASLNSTLIYFGVVTTIVVAVAGGGAIPLSLALFFLALYPVGLGLFLLPLRSLHRKLVEAKQEELGLTASRYERVVEEVSRGGSVDQSLANEMAVVTEIRREVQQIHTWPFDTGIIIRLAAVILSLTAILLSAVIRDLLHF